MADGQLNLSRRALLGGACASPLIPRHPGLDDRAELSPGEFIRGPDHGSTCFLSDVPQSQQGRWIADQVRNDAPGQSRTVTKWDRALARFRRAEAALASVGGTEDDRLYDRILGRLNKALSALLAIPAPHAVALADKLDLLVQHQVWELRFAEPSLLALRRDAHRLAASAA